MSSDTFQASEKDLENSAEGSVHSSDEALEWSLRKSEAIQSACELRDVGSLVSLATSKGGFLRDELRRLACMIPSNSQTYVVITRL